MYRRGEIKETVNFTSNFFLMHLKIIN